MYSKEKEADLELFQKFKSSLLNIDPVYFCQKYLTLDGKPFRIEGNGYKPFSDIYRYIGIKALEKDSKPVILLKGRQTGGTTMANALEMYFVGCGLFGTNDRPPIRIMHTFPQLEHAEAYSKTKLNPMIASSIPAEDNNLKIKKSYMQSLLDTTSDSNDSLKFKQFRGGNHIWIDATGLTGDRLRGRSADIMLMDEIQDTPGEAISNSLKILTAAKYGKPGKGVQVFFGTPKRKGSDFYKMWQVSSQQYFYLGCEKCEKHFPLYTPGSDEWEKIWLYDFIVKCTHCGHEQDKRPAAERGKWFSLQDNPDDCQLIGFHINQLYMPFFTKQDILNEKPNIHPINTERAYQNEVLGEFFQGDSSPITIEEIIEKCGDPERKMKSNILPDNNQIIVMGVDYGGRNDMEQLANPNKGKIAGQSFSTAVVLSSTGPGLLSIERAVKFKKNDLESKKGIIDQLYRDYSIQLAVGDIGYSNDFSEIMHVAYGDKYLASRAHTKINDHIKFRQDAFPKEIIFERDHYIAEMFNMMKKGAIRFPLGHYDYISWLIDHCTSMEIKPSISRIGEPTLHYVKGNTPNDGFMALLNAYIAYKFIITKGFTTNNPILQEQNYKTKNKPLISIGYIPRRF